MTALFLAAILCADRPLESRLSDFKAKMDDDNKKAVVKYTHGDF